MTITFPRTDIMAAAGWAEQVFELVDRQELSRTAGGQTIGKDFGSAKWRARFSSVPVTNADALALEAMLRSLDGVLRTFHAGDQRRRFPRAYPTGVFSESGVAIHTVGGDGRSLRIDGLAAGFVLSAGDFFAVNRTVGSGRDLYQIVEAATADGSGITPLFEVRPHIVIGTAVDDAVVLKDPTGIFRLEPGSLEVQQGIVNSVVGFSAVQA